MKGKIKIRVAEIKDIHRITEIYNEALVASSFVQDNNVHTLEKRIEWFSQKRAEGLPVYVAENNQGRVVGFANLNIFLTAEYDTTVHISIYVAEGNRGLGIGKIMIKKLIEWSKENQKHTILAGIDSENMPSIRLHESFGFVEVASFNEVIKKFGLYRNLNFYQLMLKQEE
ncbi:N-acetyltransferase family protein [Flavobacterium anhuiense]|uniref:GNAT family N-acetyltransferase n=1 Tax=Flavobacterium anhuiense TaxID=459526 RepID=UPI003D99A0C8